MDDRRGAEGIEHLQAAAREMLAAARSFLDVVEDVVEDPERLSAAASSVVEMVRGGVASATRPTSPLQPWEQAAWGTEGSPVEPSDDGAGVGWDDDPGDEDLGGDIEAVGDLRDAAGSGEDPDPVGPTIDLDALEESDGESTDVTRDPPAAPRRRVRRIAVD